MKTLIVFVIVYFIIIRAGKPPKHPPSELKDGYTRNGSVSIEEFYVDDTNMGLETHFVFTTKNIEHYLKATMKIYANIEMEYDHPMEEDEFNHQFMRQPQKNWIFYALKRYQTSIINSNVVVFGSTEPYIETAVLGLGATQVTTVEYNNLTYIHPQITTISKYNFTSLYQCNSIYKNSFDIALSISSFDHDGLGRYGDPLNPDGDLHAMMKTMNLVKPGGILFLTIPIGTDLVVFNLLRRYGKIRLPLLLKNWEIIEKLFWDDKKLDVYEKNYRRSYEPVLVLRKPLETSDNIQLCNGFEDSSSNINTISTSGSSSTVTTTTTSSISGTNNDNNINLNNEQIVSNKNKNSIIAEL